MTTPEATTKPNRTRTRKSKTKTPPQPASPAKPVVVEETAETGAATGSTIGEQFPDFDLDFEEEEVHVDKEELPTSFWTMNKEQQIVALTELSDRLAKSGDVVGSEACAGLAAHLRNNDLDKKVGKFQSYLEALSAGAKTGAHLIVLFAGAVTVGAALGKYFRGD